MSKKRVRVYSARDILKFHKGTKVTLFFWRWCGYGPKPHRGLVPKFLKRSDLEMHRDTKNSILGGNLSIIALRKQGKSWSCSYEIDHGEFIGGSTFDYFEVER